VKKLSSLSVPKLSGQLGVALCLLGLLLVFLGWNGAASRDRVPAQFPYLISGGVAGLCLVVIGVGMIVVQNQRADRAALQSSLERLREAVERAGGAAAVAAGDGRAAAAAGVAGVVVAGRSSFHRPGCHLVDGRDVDLVDASEAAERGLSRCRVCKPPVAPAAATTH